MAGIYIHIPFCKQKCLYCDFVSGQGCDADMEEYQSALMNEIESTEAKEEVDSIFFGGGTPSVYPVKYIEEILGLIKSKWKISRECEITIEVNPGTVDLEKLNKYKAAGINRISMGLQSANDNELKKLGRIHNYSDFVVSYENVRKVGFDNVNIDLMSAIPGQTLDSYKETLKKVVEMKPEHISSYSLIVEEGTPFFEWYGEDGEKQAELPDEDIEREMYYFTKQYLEKSGYERYEISNYAKKGYECRHNIKYWERKNYYGFGVAAASLLNNVRYTNISDKKIYIQNKGNISKIREDIDVIDKVEQMEEYMFLGLRKIKGVSIMEFFNIFNVDINEVYKDVVKKHLEKGLCTIEGDYLRLTERGIDISNFVMSDYIKKV